MEGTLIDEGYAEEENQNHLFVFGSAFEVILENKIFQ